MDTKTYYLVRFETLDPEKDYQQCISLLLTGKGILIEQEGTEAAISYRDHPFKARFSLTKSNSFPGTSGQASMMLVSEPADFLTIDIIRSVARQMEYRVYSVAHQSFLPVDPDLLETTVQLSATEKGSEVFSKKGLIPVFAHRHDGITYAKRVSDGTVHIINPYLLHYFLDNGADSSFALEFSYIVATGTNEFVSLYDQDLIPTSFYSHYRKPLRLFNYSDFDIDHIDRKVFVHPFFYSYNDKKQAYEPIAAFDSALHSFASKVLKGETLETALRRMVRDELKLADDYVRARVTKRIGFDRDREGRLTPRLYVCVYMTHVTWTDFTKQKAERGWTKWQ